MSQRYSRGPDRSNPAGASSVVSRVQGPAVALETTLLLHGVPREVAPRLARELSDIVTRAGAMPAPIGVLDGQAIAGLTEDELATMLKADVPKVNLANLGLSIHRGHHGATTVSSTMAIAAEAGIRVFATGGLGGVHPGYGTQLDVSADLMALSQYPVAVVTSGCKAVLDVQSTREALETLGVPVVGFGTDVFPAFYLRDSAASVDARFDDVADLAAFCAMELERTGRGIVVAHPIPEADEIAADDWERWYGQAQAETVHLGGRDRTPAILAALHRISGGGTLTANLALVRANTKLAAELAVSMR